MDYSRLYGLNLYTYLNNSPINFTSSIESNNSQSVLKSLLNNLNGKNRKSKSPNYQLELNFPQANKLLDEAVTLIEYGFTYSDFAITVYYLTKNGTYLLATTAMKLDKVWGYSNYVGTTWFGLGFVFLQTVIDIASNIQEGRSTEYVTLSAIYTALTGTCVLLLTHHLYAVAIMGPHGVMAGAAVIMLGIMLTLIFALLKEPVLE